MFQKRRKKIINFWKENMKYDIFYAEKEKYEFIDRYARTKFAKKETRMYI